MAEAVTRYAVNPIGPFPKRWRDRQGKALRVMSEPAEGYLMARYRGRIPFVIKVTEILNTAPHSAGPFRCEDVPGRFSGIRVKGRQ